MRPGPLPARLLVLAEDPLARAGLAAALSGLAIAELAATADLGADAPAALAFASPDLVLVDLGWAPEASLERLGELELGAPLALLTSPAWAAAAWALGPRALLPRDLTAETLAAALAAALAGLVVLHPSLAGALTAPDPAAALGPAAADLTPREREVLRWLAEGWPNKAIARELGISEHTVKFHVNGLLAKLGAQSRTEAAIRAARLGLVPG